MINIKNDFNNIIYLICYKYYLYLKNNFQIYNKYKYKLIIIFI